MTEQRMYCSACGREAAITETRLVPEPDGHLSEFHCCHACVNASDAALMLADEWSWPDEDSGQRPWLHNMYSGIFT